MSRRYRRRAQTCEGVPAAPGTPSGIDNEKQFKQNRTPRGARRQCAPLISRREIVESARLNTMSRWLSTRPGAQPPGTPLAVALFHALRNDARAGPRWFIASWPDDGHTGGCAVELNPPHDVDSDALVRAYFQRDERVMKLSTTASAVAGACARPH
jgi:hypothetical protein